MAIESIALIIGIAQRPLLEPREQGWSDAFRSHDLPPGPIVRTSFSRLGGYEAAVQLLSWPTRPNAIFAASDELATGALEGDSGSGSCAVLTTLPSSPTTARWSLNIARRRSRLLNSRSGRWRRAAVSAVLDASLLLGTSPSPQRSSIRESCGCRNSAHASRS